MTAYYRHAEDVMAMWCLRSVTLNIEFVETSVSHAELSQAKRNPNQSEIRLTSLGLALISFRHVFLPKGGCAQTLSKVVFFNQTVLRRSFVRLSPLLKRIERRRPARHAGCLRVLLNIGPGRRVSARLVLRCTLRVGVSGESSFLAHDLAYSYSRALAVSQWQSYPVLKLDPTVLACEMPRCKASFSAI
jgi:hypothetical protein